MHSSLTDSLVAEFLERARVTTATAEIVQKSPSALDAALAAAVDGEVAVMLAPPTDLPPELFETFALHPNVITRPSREQLKMTRVGITDAFAGVARTGSVCIAVGNNMTAPIGMLSRKHIVVLDAETIVPRPRDVLSEPYLGGKGLQRSFSFITGPSATADMGPLVRGVHGPGALHIIVLG